MNVTSQEGPGEAVHIVLYRWVRFLCDIEGAGVPKGEERSDE